MTQTPFDQFSKQHLKGLLSPLGTVNISREVPGEPLSIDLWFEPDTQAEVDRAELGLLGQIAATPCLLEPFRNSPAPAEIRSCLQKLYWIHGEFQRQAERSKCPLTEAALPRLWILAPSLSGQRIQDLGVTADPDRWCAGIYVWGPILKAAIVAINQLPETQDTLWLRLMGRGKTQKRAIQETLALPAEDAFRADALQLLATWKITIETSGMQNWEDAETMSTFMEVYQELVEKDRQRDAKVEETERKLSTFMEGYQELLEKDRQRDAKLEETERKLAQLQGSSEEAQRNVEEVKRKVFELQQRRQQERCAMLEGLLKLRFGELDESLMAMVQRLVELPDEQYVQCLPQVFSLAREALLAQFGPENPGQ